MTDKEKLAKLVKILDLDIGWATPKDLLDTIRREVLDTFDDEDKMDSARNAYIAGIIRAWVERLQQHDTAKQSCITDMLEFSDKLAKSAGVTIFKGE